MRSQDRRSPRLPGFDYREVGAYFITICTNEKECVLGEVASDDVVLSRVGLIARDEWRRTLDLRTYIDPIASVVMPNHVHLLFGLWTGDQAGLPPWIDSDNDDPRRDKACLVPSRPGAPPPMSVPAIIGAYKASVTRHVRRSGVWGAEPLWQGRYHDRVVRSERELTAFHTYIVDNPRRWHEDRFFR